VTLLTAKSTIPSRNQPMKDFCIAYVELSNKHAIETAQVVSLSIVPVVNLEVQWSKLLYIPAIRPAYGSSFQGCIIAASKLVEGIDILVACAAVRDFLHQNISSPLIVNSLAIAIDPLRKLFNTAVTTVYYSSTVPSSQCYLDYESIFVGRLGVDVAKATSLTHMIQHLTPILKLTEKK